MLTRLYIDNFRCFVNFEFKPARRQLILGDNGSGKSSFLDALLFLREFVSTGGVLPGSFLSQRTRWLDQPRLTFELEATLEGSRYSYRLVIEPSGEPARPRVASETVQCDGKPLFEFIKAEVHLYTDETEPKATYEFDPERSALATIVPGGGNQRLGRFKKWFSTLYCFRINPFGMEVYASGESLYPNFSLSNVAAWYRHLVQSDPAQNAELLQNLRACMDGFRILKLDPFGDSVRTIAAEFTQNGGEARSFYFHELSDGQRCIICLYTILHFVLAKGSTVILDEPDNFISLREIQPWLMGVADAVEDGVGQALLISHHPEVINQWAPGSGVQFVRDEAGAVRVEEFRGDPDDCLAPSELVARGWERE
jgi:energy-coupling factor transporter ATP-binding protein EcfA2